MRMRVSSVEGKMAIEHEAYRKIWNEHASIAIGLIVIAFMLATALYLVALQTMFTFSVPVALLIALPVILADTHRRMNDCAYGGRWYEEATRKRWRRLHPDDPLPVIVFYRGPSFTV
ncbi:MAG: hypothetical protein AAB790_02590 [Patescibacteria group bacterium]